MSSKETPSRARSYAAPKLVEYGALNDVTLAMATGGSKDGGVVTKGASNEKTGL